MTQEQKINFLLKIPYINLFKLQKTYTKNLYLVGGNTNDDIDYLNEYNKEYDKKTGKYNIEIKDNKYYFRVERYSTGEGTKYEDKEFKFIDFITIEEKYKNNIDCGSISINNKNKTATITSLGNNSKCLKSKNNIEFKNGDILFQIMLYICKKEKIKKIELTDNSYIKCGNIELCLDYLKTLTYGYPHYHKYGFKFKYTEDNKILKENYYNFKTDPKITKTNFLLLLQNKKIDNQIINQLNKILEKIPNDNISIKKIVLLFTKKLNDNENCDFIHKIYIDLYREAGYKPFYTKDYYIKI